MAQDTQTAPAESESSTTSTFDKMKGALDSGQLGNPVDDGPTPDNDSPASTSAAQGPTPEGHPTQTQDPEPAPSKQDEGAEDEPTPSSDERSDEQEEGEAEGAEDAAEPADSEESEDGSDDSDDWYFEGEHSRYRTKEEFEKAIDNKDALTIKQRKEIANLRQEVEETKALLESQRRVMPDEYKKELVMRQYVADELGEEAEEILQMSEEDLAQSPELERKLEKARIKAEVRYEDALEKAQKQQKQQIERRKKTLQEADQFVRGQVTPSTFDANSVEERIRLGEFFQEEVGQSGLNRAEVAVLMYNDYGETAARSYLDGLKSEFKGNQQERVDREISKSDPDPKPPASPPSDEPAEEPADAQPAATGDNALDTLFNALQNQ